MKTLSQITEYAEELAYHYKCTVKDILACMQTIHNENKTKNRENTDYYIEKLINKTK